jgi:hypothetical protein
MLKCSEAIWLLPKHELVLRYGLQTVKIVTGLNGMLVY